MPTASKVDKQKSLVHAVDQSGNIFKGFTFWTDLGPAVKASPEMMFAKALLVGGSDVRENCLLWLCFIDTTDIKISHFGLNQES